jgi:hypothetical protein
MLSGTSDLEIGILKFSSEDTEATLAVPQLDQHMLMTLSSVSTQQVCLEIITLIFVFFNQIFINILQAFVACQAMNNVYCTNKFHPFKFVW